MPEINIKSKHKQMMPLVCMHKMTKRLPHN